MGEASGKFEEGQRVVFLCSYPFPDSSAVANRIRSLAAHLGSQGGWDPWIVSTGSSSCLSQTKGFRWIGCSNKRGNRTGLISRAFREIRQAFLLILQARKLGAEILVVTVPSVPLLFMSLLLPSNKLVIDVRDCVWDYLITLGGGKRLVGRITRTLAWFLLRRARLVVTTNSQQATALAKLSNRSIQVVPNGISWEKLDAVSQLVSAEQCVKFPRIICYFGNLGIAQELDTLIEAVNLTEEWKAVLIGEGADAVRLRRLADKLSPEKVEFTGKLTWEAIVRKVDDCEILFAQIGESYGSAVPTKIFEYVSLGKPTVFGLPRGGAGEEVAKQFYGTAVVPPGDAEALCEFLGRWSIEDAPSDTEIVYNQKKLKDEYSREKAAEKFEDLLEEVGVGDRSNDGSISANGV